MTLDDATQQNDILVRTDNLKNKLTNNGTVNYRIQATMSYESNSTIKDATTDNKIIFIRHLTIKLS